MVRSLSDKVVAILGGDKRDVYVVQAFISEGAQVRIIGVPEAPETQGAQWVSTPQEAVNGADVVIAPISGTHPDGTLRVTEIPITINDELIELMHPNAVFIIGMATQAIFTACERQGVTIVQYLDNDEVAILNSIPSAEGAIQIIMAETPITIHGADIVLLGYGRTCQTTAHKLAALGAKVTVFARKQSDLARAIAMGVQAYPYSELETSIAKADIIVNTVPTMMLPKRTLEKVRRDCFILDLASTPGGVDFQAAATLGIKAILSPSLPGRVAPKTAGGILAKILPRLAKAELGLTE